MANLIADQNIRDVFLAAGGPLHDEDDIRLLELAPRPPDNPIITGRLFNTNRSKNPLYTAISYTWGKTSPRNMDSMYNILLNGNKQVSISHNLFQVLSGLGRPNQSRILWVDALCINQSDAEERSSQVEMMGKIFSAANQVIAWIQCSCQHQEFGPEADACGALRLLRMGASSESGFDIEGQNFLILRRFFADVYWTRRWIVQELALSRMITIYVGEDAITMATLQTFLNKSIQSSTLQALDLRRSMASRICHFRKEEIVRSTTLEELLTMYDETQCSEPVDKVFSLLSLAGSARNHLKVNYQISAKDLLFQVLNYAWQYEGLQRNSHTVGLASLLRTTLRITLDDIESVTESSSLADVFESRHARLFFRGAVSRHPFNAIGEEAIRACRDHLPNLLNFSPFSFEPIFEKDYFEIESIPVAIVDRKTLSRPEALEYSDLRLAPKRLVPTKANTSSAGPSPLSGQDFRPFTYRRPARKLSAGKTEASPGIGLASVHVEIGDQVLQFQGTPVALIARECVSGLLIVGRAFLLHSERLGHDFSLQDNYHATTRAHLTLRDILDFADSIVLEDRQLAPTRALRTHFTPLELLHLLKWTSVDVEDNSAVRKPETQPTAGSVAINGL